MCVIWQFRKVYIFTLHDVHMRIQTSKLDLQSAGSGPYLTYAHVLDLAVHLDGSMGSF